MRSGCMSLAATKRASAVRHIVVQSGRWRTKATKSPQTRGSPAGELPKTASPFRRSSIPDIATICNAVFHLPKELTFTACSTRKPYINFCTASQACQATTPHGPDLVDIELRCSNNRSHSEINNQGVLYLAAKIPNQPAAKGLRKHPVDGESPQWLKFACGKLAATGRPFSISA
jgi:hypothetical protein